MDSIAMLNELLAKVQALIDSIAAEKQAAFDAGVASVVCPPAVDASEQVAAAVAALKADLLAKLKELDMAEDAAVEALLV